MKTDFFKPADVKEAISLLDRYQEKAIIVNGGSDIVEKIANGQKKPEAIIYINDIDELKQIRESEGDIRIGGAVTYTQMLKSPVIQKVKGMVEAVSQLGSPAIRQLATPAGNIGNGAPSADCTTMLMGLEAKVVIVNASGERVVPIEEFFVKTYQTVLQPNELIREIYFAAPKKGDGTGYYRIARRKAQDIGKVLVSVSLNVDKGICKKAAIGLGALNATAVRGTSIEKALIGKTKEESLSYIRDNFPKEAGLRPSRFTRYKELVTCVAVERAVGMAWEDAEEVK